MSKLIKQQCLPQRETALEKTSELLTFFGISNHKAWEGYYLKQQLKVAFRISLAHTKEPFAISAWLRKGELQAAELSAKIYSEKKFKDQLTEIKSLMAKHPSDFLNKLQTLCLGAGVKVVYTPCLPKAPINGATRWMNDTPLIQLTGRFKRNDSFWFTFFHEAGHILLHGKKDIFLENISYSEYDKHKEKEADDFAIKWTLTEEEEYEIINEMPLDVNDIKKFSKKFNTHPAIIIGRLQHNQILPYSFGRQFFESILID